MALYSPCISSDEASGGKVVEGSLLFQKGSSDYLSRTFGAGDQRTKTFSFWVLRTELGATQCIFSTDVSGFIEGRLAFLSSEILQITDRDSSSGSTDADIQTSAVLRDLSGWYHIVFAYDTTNGSGGDRMRLYVNGVELTAFGSDTNPAQNYEVSLFRNSALNYIGTNDTSDYSSMCLAQVYYIDGQALDASYFGFSDPLTGIWKPKKYVNTVASPGDAGGAVGYGTCGFYLPFDGSAAIGLDQSGQKNDWTASNVADADVSYQSPSGIALSADPNAGITTTGFPTTYATLDFNTYDMSTCANKSEGGLKAQIGNSGTATAHPIGNMAVSSGKWYYEWTWISTTDSAAWCALANPHTEYSNGKLDNFWKLRGGGGERDFVLGGSLQEQVDTNADYSVGDTIGVAIDMDDGKWYLSTNGTWQDCGNGAGNPEAGTGYVFNNLKSAGTGIVIPYWGTDGGSTTCEMRANFGQSTFKFLPPKGFKPMCASNLTAPEVTRPFKYWEAIMYTGDDESPDIRVRTTSGFSPDFVFMKSRTQTYGWYAFDSVRRGADDESDPAPGMACYGQLYFDSTAVQGNGGHNGIGLIKGGFNVDYQGQAIGEADQGSNNMVSYSFKAGGYRNTFNVDDRGYASAATAGLNGGTLTPTAASVGTKQGFSIIQYEGNSTADATISHGLGKTPAFTIIKNLDSTSGSWAAKHKDMASTKQCFVHNNNAEAVSSYGYIKDYSGTSTISFATGGSNWENTNATGDTLVAYIWAEIEGASKFGKYVGNGNADGPYVKLGFKPAILIIKCISNAESWNIFDNARDPDNYVHHYLGLNINTEENSTTTARRLDFYSDGFKLRGNDGTFNTDTYTYVYAAWAETPQHNLYGGIGNAR